MDAASRVKRLIDEGEPPVVVYHWDADGILSAMTLLLYLGGRSEDAELVPPRYTFRVTDSFLEELKSRAGGSRPIVVLDLNYHPRDLARIASIGSPVAVIDHHYYPYKPPEGVVYFNPAAGGDPRGEWPSATYTLGRVIKAYHPLLTAASIVGDLGEAAKSNRAYREMMGEAGLDPEEDYWIPKEVVEQLSSIEASGRYEPLITIPRMMTLETVEPVKGIINEAFLATLRAQVEYEYRILLGEAVEGAEDRGGIVVASLEGEGRHASRLSRELASRFRDKIVVLAYKSRATGEARIYIRSTRPFNVDLVIREAAGRGYSAGGKRQEGNYVVGIEVEGVDIGGALEDIVRVVLRASSGRSGS